MEVKCQRNLFTKMHAKHDRNHQGILLNKTSLINDSHIVALKLPFLNFIYINILTVIFTTLKENGNLKMVTSKLTVS